MRYELGQSAARRDWVELALQRAEGYPPPEAKTIQALAQAAGVTADPAAAFRASAALAKIVIFPGVIEEVDDEPTNEDAADRPEVVSD